MIHLVPKNVFVQKAARVGGEIALQYVLESTGRRINSTFLKSTGSWTYFCDVKALVTSGAVMCVVVKH